MDRQERDVDNSKSRFKGHQGSRNCSEQHVREKHKNLVEKRSGQIQQTFQDTEEIRQQNEVAFRLQQVDTWLKKLKTQIESETFNLNEFKESNLPPATRKTNKTVQDLCMKLIAKQKEHTDKEACVNPELEEFANYECDDISSPKYIKSDGNSESVLQKKKLDCRKNKHSGSIQQKYVKMETYAVLKERENSLLEEIQMLKSEKDELLNRLSKVAGANLTENNPNIADLSDPNRATKLSEQYSELYDNSWTNAIDVLETQDEKDRIGFLLNILTGTYQDCRLISQNQHDMLKNALLCPSEGITHEKISKEERIITETSLSKVMSNTLTELRKQCSNLSVENVKSFISTAHEKWVEKEELRKYTHQCIELCWLMHVQSPPVYLDVHADEGSSLQTNFYRHYTKSGTKVDFLVWPALLLYESGPVLCKGVVQGK